MGSLANPKVVSRLSIKYTLGLVLVPVPRSLGLVSDDDGVRDVGAEDGAGDVDGTADDGVPGGLLEEAAAGGLYGDLL